MTLSPTCSTRFHAKRALRRKLMSNQDLSPMALEREFLAFIEAVSKENLRYALIGGLALAIYGYVRYTKDIDIVICADDLPRFKEILKKLDYILDNGRLPFPSTGMTFYRMGKFVEETVLSIDMLLEPNDSSLLSNPTKVVRNEVALYVVTKDQLIEMKSKSTRGKDLVDIEELNALTKENQNA